MTWLIALACIAGLTIEAPKSSPRDKLVRCMAKVDAGREVVTYLWDVESRGADVDVDRETAAERLWWVASPGRYRVEVIVGYAGGGIERARVDVVIEGQRDERLRPETADRLGQRRLAGDRVSRTAVGEQVIIVYYARRERDLRQWVPPLPWKDEEDFRRWVSERRAEGAKRSDKKTEAKQC